MKRILTAGALALTLAGCAAGPYAAGPYYDTYDYDAYGNPVYYGGPASYADPAYYSGPSVSFGYYYFDNDGQRHWRVGDRGRWSGQRDDHRGWSGRGNDGRASNPPNSGQSYPSNAIRQDPGAGR